MWKSKFYHTGSSLIAESKIFVVSHKGLKITFPARVLIFCFRLKKTAAEAHRMLSSTYGEAAFDERTCREWFQRFKSGDFDVDDRHGGGKDNIFELEALLAEDSCQTQEELAE